MTTWSQYEKRRKAEGRQLLQSFNRAALRRALWLLRRETARPHEPNPAAAQYGGLITLGMVRAEYRRRMWKLPKPTRRERP